MILLSAVVRDMKEGNGDPQHSSHSLRKADIQLQNLARLSFRTILREPYGIHVKRWNREVGASTFMAYRVPPPHGQMNEYQ
jgi:hypothetical protein